MCQTKFAIIICLRTNVDFTTTLIIVIIVKTKLFIYYYYYVSMFVSHYNKINDFVSSVLIFNAIILFYCCLLLQTKF